MKKLQFLRALSVFILLFSIVGCLSNNPSLQRYSNVERPIAIQYGGSLRDDCTSMIVDKSGNIFCSGFTNNSLGETNASLGSADAYVAKYSASGTLLWLTQLGNFTKDTQGTPNPADDGDNSSQDYCASIVLDDDENVYCAGQTLSSMDGPGSSQGGRDIFVFKLNKNGELQWLTQTGSSGDDVPSSILIGPDKNLFVAGHSNGPFVTAENATARTDYDLVVLKITPSGSILGKLQLGEDKLSNKNSNNLSSLISISGSDLVSKILNSGEGNLIVMGSTNDSLAAVNSDGSFDHYLFKLTPNLDPLWIKQYPYPAENRLSDGLIDDSGKIYISGYTFGSISEPNAGGADAFVSKFDSNGNELTSAQLGSITRTPGGDLSFEDSCSSIAMDRKQNIYCLGRTKGDLGERNGDPSHATTDLFIAKWDSNLRFQSAIQMGAITRVPGGDTSKNEYSSASQLWFDYFGHMYFSGTTFGALGGTNAGAERDIFIFKQDISTLDLNFAKY
jgi:hypothetical protein